MKVPGNASALKPVFSGVQLKSSHSPSPVANWLWMLPDLMKLILPDLYAYIFR
ncbi:Uncharacterised protein [Salmonella enterica subsp. enterica serovar Typhimurium str. DT104]|uniref:Uncharacterized protein n=2 Tax=Salmonella enterica I TaxID=59201 RepID=A0A655DYG9_SALET|nr:Uncharacterised protein [Salmonella enterica subsp. enterica serovar Bovismorbificans]CQA87378.1 Uncharacterised protein [Salmonella enterica subsp. enterica serovar Typhimurium str. DT104]VDY41203.1 Uncharacterised protein [Salmonella enterica subsp. enterica serovar Daytona]CNU03987.1 Uncharacterised protein [Salmonella enterica subsp. enterica serovar Bovismorbificans]CNU61844.1 Uncharacterised protein [Salmonella enterica subsp. enterica serovar Bovismorbificans]